MSDAHAKMKELEGLMEVGNALVESINDVVYWPECPECGESTSIVDSSGEVLEAPNFFCENCQETREIEDGWSDEE